MTKICPRCSKTFTVTRKYEGKLFCSRECGRAATVAKGGGWYTDSAAMGISLERRKRVAQLTAERPPCPCGRGPCMLSHPICGQCFQEKGAQP